jgi:dTDP-4-amino-4,6-dideoxygalactose transaminase
MRPVVGKEEINEVKKVIKSKFLTEGEVTRKFESDIARYVKAKFAIATTSATTALHTSFHCMNIKKKKVLVSDFTFPATADAIIQAGGIPILMDVDKNSMNVTRVIAEDSLDKSIDYIVPVSLFGNPLEENFYKLKKSGLKIIEDAATNLGTKIAKKFVGSIADVTCFSFHPRKIITTGEGGMITTNDKKLAEKFRIFKTFGKKGSEFNEIGTNYKLSDIQSAIGLAQLKKIEKIIQKRQHRAKIYNEMLSKIDFFTSQEPTSKSFHTYQSFTCVVTKQGSRNRIMKELKKNNVETQIGTYALHCLPAFRRLMKKGKLKNSEFLFKNSISLPLHEELSFNDQEYICKIIKKTLN